MSLLDLFRTPVKNKSANNRTSVVKSRSARGHPSRLVSDSDQMSNDDEREFFRSFETQLRNSGYDPENIRLSRLASGMFNVNFKNPNCYIGKIDLHKSPVKYAVFKNGNKGATRVFETEEEANVFASTDSAYSVRVREAKRNIHMQYSIGLYDIRELNDSTLAECIDAIPHWIARLDYCKKEYDDP